MTPEQLLATSVRKLTSQHETRHMQRVPGGGRREVVVKHDALIGMLRAASTSTTGAHSGSSANDRSVLDSDALEKLRDLHTAVYAAWADLSPGIARAFPSPRWLPLEELLDAWHIMFAEHRHHGLITDDQLESARAVFAGWVKTIEAKFDPPRAIEYTHPCPRCRERWATSAEGDRVAAITIQYRGSLAESAATCRNCGEVWRGEQRLKDLGAGRVSPGFVPREVSPEEVHPAASATRPA